MIYVSDDYLEKYQNVFSYLLGRAIAEKYSLEHITFSIAYSKLCQELERSNATTIAFSSCEKIYQDIFPLFENKGIEIDNYGIYGWLGHIYIRLFLDLKTTFEMLFFIFPLHVALDSYHLYHEMDYSALLNYVKKRSEPSHLDVVMEKKNISSHRLSVLTDIPFSTINALRYGNRDFDKLETFKALKIATSLNVKAESLTKEIPLVIK